MEFFSLEDKNNFWNLEEKLAREFKGIDLTVNGLPTRNFWEIPASVILSEESPRPVSDIISDNEVLENELPPSVIDPDESVSILEPKSPPSPNGEVIKVNDKDAEDDQSTVISSPDVSLWDAFEFDLDSYEPTPKRGKRTKIKTSREKAEIKKESKLEKILKDHPDLKQEVEVHVLKLPSFMIDSKEEAFILDQTYRAMHNNMFKDAVQTYNLKPYSDSYLNKGNDDYDDFSSYQQALLDTFEPLSPQPYQQCHTLSSTDTDGEDLDTLQPSTSKVGKRRARMSTTPRKRMRILSDTETESDNSTNYFDTFEELVCPSDGDEEENDLSEPDNSKAKKGPSRRRQSSSTQDEIDRSLMKRYPKSKTKKSTNVDDTKSRKKKVSDENAPPQESQEDARTKDASSETNNTPENIQGVARKGRRNILRPKSEHEIEVATRESTTRERKRLEKLEKVQSVLEEVRKKNPQDLILDVDPKTKEVRVKVDSYFLKDLKGHQRKGIEFMYANCIGDIDNLDESATGCVLAHCMGLGKTFQTIVLVHTLLTNQYLKDHFKRILIAAPVNTLKNWYYEFQQWLPRHDRHTIKFWTIFNCSQFMRANMLNDWYAKGGVSIIGYHGFLNCLKSNKKSKSKSKLEGVTKALLDPGPDLLIIDEGHLLKNEKSQLCKMFQKVTTLRKIILTGTPMQNNLNEYYTMIDLIKPHLLGSKKEFDNRFKNPIDNGLHADSNVADIQIMKTRIAVLNRLLSGSVQRYDHDELAPYLKEKFEFAVFVQPTDLIIQMYNYYLDNQSSKSNRFLLSDSILLRLICSHPAILPLRYEKEKRIQTAREEAGKRRNAANTQHIESQLKLGEDIFNDPEDDFIIVLDHSGKEGEDNQRPASSITANSSLPVNTCEVTSKPSKNQVANVESCSSHDNTAEINDRSHWFWQFVNSDEEFKRIELSSKFMVFFFILGRCIALEEKLVVASQCLETLDLIESLLQTNKNFSINNETTIEMQWKKDHNYFRIDGTVTLDKRTASVSAFNDSENKDAKLFLLATKAGGLGINLVGANRCIMFDCHWNPMVDLQAIFRVYRLGQTKPVYIYRLITKGTMEEKIYKMQVLKTGLSIRVVDKTNIKNAISKADVHEYYNIRPQKEYECNMRPPNDKLLGDLILKHKDLVVDYCEHQSLLQRRPEDDISPQEIQAAWEIYQKERDEEKSREEEEARRLIYLASEKQRLAAEARFQERQKQNYLEQQQQEQESGRALNDSLVDTIEPSISELPSDQYISYLQDLSLHSYNSLGMYLTDNNQNGPSCPDEQAYDYSIRAASTLVADSIEYMRSSKRDSES